MPSSPLPAALADAVAVTVDGERHEIVGLGTSFALDPGHGDVVDATLWVTAHGVVEVRLNGAPVSGAVLDPGWTAYEWRLPVVDHPVAHLLVADNVLDVRLAGGWYRGDLGFEGAAASYGKDLALLAVLVIRFSDGTEQVVPTSTSWTGYRTDSPEASLYGGQVVDARLRSARLETRPVRAVDLDRTTLVPRSGPPVERQERLAPAALTRSPSGRVLVDFGQNLVGWVHCRVEAPAGTRIVLRHAEVLEGGELGTRPLRGARATDTFVCSGGPDEFEPTMTFHGFRYVEVTGWPGDLTLAVAREALEAVVVHSRMRRTGWFECSDPLVNRLAENSVWGQRGNFLAVPTDCPQRDERLGWTGDIAVYAPTACTQFDVADFLHSWLLDLAAEVRGSERGIVPHVVPDVLKHGTFPPEMAAMLEHWRAATALWGDAAVWVPMALWRAYGDRGRLAAHYPGMVLHLRSVEAVLSPSGLWDEGFQLGDWLDPDAPPDQPWAAKADPGVVATACVFRSAALAAEAAGELGLDEDAAHWRTLAARTRSAFLEHYVDPDGRVRSDCATVYALALTFGLLDGDPRRRTAAGRLAEAVRAAGHRVSTGFAGTPFVTWALSENGHVADAYRLLLQRECPSWLYPVTMGATTVWERWDSMLPDGSVNPGEMTSFNHYALGAVADWLFGAVAGIRPVEPGYTRARLSPSPGPGLDWARAVLDTPRGRLECGWEREGGEVVVRAVVPDGVEADVVLPDGTGRTVSGGAHEFRCVTQEDTA